VCGTLAAAQPALQSALPAQSQSTAHVALGQSAVPLYGPWKFTVGDSPIDAKTGKPLWAEPDFDDSQWETVDLTPKDGAIDPTAGLSGYVPGWTAKGHPGYWGYAWYRIRVQVQTCVCSARRRGHRRKSRAALLVNPDLKEWPTEDKVQYSGAVRSLPE
jgi:hypothetical protein